MQNRSQLYYCALSDASWPAALRRVGCPLDQARVSVRIDAPDAAAIEIDMRGLLAADSRLVVSLCCLGAQPWGYRTVARSVAADAPLGTLVGIGACAPPPVACRAGAAMRADVDLFKWRGVPEPMRIVCQVRAADIHALFAAPWLCTVSLVSSMLPGVPEQVVPGTRDLPLVPISQMEQDSPHRTRICAPTCVAMLLQTYGLAAACLRLAELCYVPEVDMYGVWPAAVYAAARHGCPGCVHQFSSFAQAQQLLDAGVPLICSLRYGRGELSGAAVPATVGHLVVLRGYDAGSVLVHDPAASVRAAVPRRYDRQEFVRAWLAGSAAACIVFPPPERRPGLHREERR